MSNVFFQPKEELTIQINELVDLIKDFSLATVRDLNYNITLTSLNNRLLSLQEELNACEFYDSKMDMEIAFEGDKIENHEINGRYLADTILKTQDLLETFVVNKIGTLKSKGALPKNIKSHCEFNISALKAASFDVCIKFPSSEFLNSLFQPYSIEYIDIFKEIVTGNISKEDEDNIMSFSRLKNKYENYLKHIQNSSTIIKFRTHNQPYYSIINNTIAETRLKAFDKYKYETKDHKIIKGHLIGGDVEYGRFHIKDDSERDYNGEIAEELQGDLESYKFNSYVEVEICEINIQTEKTSKTSYKLTKIRPLEI